MGCGSSKAVEVVSSEAPLPAPGTQPPATGQQNPRTVVVEAAPPSPTPSQRSTSSTVSSRRAGHLRKNGSSRSLASLRAEEKAKREEVGRSSSRTSLSENKRKEPNNKDDIGSKQSIRTEDSGLGDDVITEHSNTEKRAAVEKEVRPPTPELCITGKGFQDTNRTTSASSRRSLPGRLQPPDEDTSIIQRPASRGGMAFDIIIASPDTDNKPRPPSRMRQIPRPRSQSAHVSSEKLRAKMAAAEQRKQQYEQEHILHKINVQKERNQQVQKALKDFAARQEKQSKGQEEKRSQISDNREAHLKALRKRLQEKEDHACKVRQAKMQAVPNPVAVQ